MAAPDDALRAQRGALADTLAQRLATGTAPLPELRALQERLTLLDAALLDRSARGPRGERVDRGPRRAAALLWPVGLVGLLLLAAASLPVPSVPLSLSIKASSLQLVLGEATRLGPLAASAGLRVEGFATLESADAGLVQAAADQQANSLSVRTADSRLRALLLPAGASLDIEAGSDATALLVDSAHSPVVVELELRGAATLLLGDAGQALVRDYGPGEWLRLTTANAAQPGQALPPLRLALARRGDPPLRLAGLRPTRLRLVERHDAAVGAVAQASSLLGATLTLPATGQVLSLAAGDGLELDGLRLERFEIVAGAPLQIELNGSARGLRQRVGEFERSLKPSWLEYLARHHLAQLLWASAGVLWAALAWLRRLLAAAGPP